MGNTRGFVLLFLTGVLVLNGSLCWSASPLDELPKEIIWERDGAPMVLVPKGGYMFGLHNELCEFPAFYIDKHEVTNEQFERFVRETGYVTTAERAGVGTVWAGGRWQVLRGCDWRHPEGRGSSLAGRGRCPVVLVSYQDTQSYCEWAGKGLPTAEQWQKAASGFRQFAYPWGNVWDEAACGNARTSQGKPIPVGSFAKDCSPFGAFDMAGSVCEWTDTAYAMITGRYLVLGSSWQHEPNPALFRLDRAGFLPPDAAWSHSGFRCCAAVPSSFGNRLKEMEIPPPTSSKPETTSRVRVRPVFLVPTDAAPPSAGYVELLTRHLRWTRERYRQLLLGRDTFEIVEGQPLVLQGGKRVAEYMASRDGGAEDAALELFTCDGVNRVSCPYVYLVFFMGTGRWPAGGGRPFNGSGNTGGGIVVMGADNLVKNRWFQCTLQHELGHGFGLVHVTAYGQDMKTSPSIMSYNPNHYTNGFEPSPTPGQLTPEDCRLLAINRRAFPSFYYGEKDYPPGYRIHDRTITLPPMEITGQPIYCVAGSQSGR